jgi:CRISPR-associated protein Cmr1
MIQIPFNCEIITPMFLAGADNCTPELRPPSIKGVMRFWWRAAQRCASLYDLKEKEAKLFGSSGEGFSKAPFNIRARELSLNKDKAQPLPHHRVNWCGPAQGCRNNNRGVCNKQFPLRCYNENGIFQVKFDSRDDSASLAGKVFRVSSILGGLGRRCRRGFGSYCIRNETGNQGSLIKKLCSLLNCLHGGNGYYIDNKYKINGTEHDNVIVGPNPTTNNYPQIKYVAVRKTTRNPDDILKKIGEASHSNSGPNCGSFEPRLASPVYFSLYKDGTGTFLITTLLSSNKIRAYQEKLIAEVMSHV